MNPAAWAPLLAQARADLRELAYWSARLGVALDAEVRAAIADAGRVVS